MDGQIAFSASYVEVFLDDGFTVSALINFDVVVAEMVYGSRGVPMSLAHQF
jgi:hypothetical protein